MKYVMFARKLGDDLDPRSDHLPRNAFARKLRSNPDDAMPVLSRSPVARRSLFCQHMKHKMRSEKGANKRVARAANLAAAILNNLDRWGKFTSVSAKRVRELTGKAAIARWESEAEVVHGDMRATGDAFNHLGIERRGGMIPINKDTVKKCKDFLAAHPEYPVGSLAESVQN